MLGDNNLEEKEIEKIECVQDILFSGDNTLSSPYPYTDDELENHPIYLSYTSGSTGKSKVVMLTSNGMLSSMKRVYPNCRSSDRVLSFMPFYFASTVSFAFHYDLLVGARIYISNAVTLDEICNDIQKYEITRFSVQPYRVAIMLKNGEHIKKNYNISSVQSINATGTAISKEVIEGVKKVFGIPVLNVYGSSETRSPFAASHAFSAMGAIGTLRPNYQARVVDQNGKDVSVDQPGELLIKGECVTKGYYNNPKETAKAFTEDSYYRTGDVVKRDVDGIFWFLSRCKDLMKYQSTHIYPCDIEKVVLTHPKVAECGVISVFSQELLNDLPRAYITLVHKEDYENKEAIAKEVLEYTNKQLPELKRIRAGVFVKDTLKKTATDKIIYSILREEAANDGTNQNIVSF